VKKLVFLIISAGLLASTPVSGMKRAKTTAAKRKAVKKETKVEQGETQEQKEEKAALVLQKYIRTYLAKKKAAAEWVKGLAHQLVDGVLDGKLPKEMIISKLKSVPKTLRPFIADELLNLITLKGLVPHQILRDILALTFSVSDDNNIIDTLNKELFASSIDQELVNILKQAPEIERKIKKFINYISYRTDEEKEAFLALTNELKTICEQIATHCSSPISKSVFTKASNIFNIIYSSEQLGLKINDQFVLQIMISIIDGFSGAIKSKVTNFLQRQAVTASRDPFDLFFSLQANHASPIMPVGHVIHANASDLDSSTEQ